MRVSHTRLHKPQLCSVYSKFFFLDKIKIIRACSQQQQQLAMIWYISDSDVCVHSANECSQVTEQLRK